LAADILRRDAPLEPSILISFVSVSFACAATGKQTATKWNAPFFATMF